MPHGNRRKRTLFAFYIALGWLVLTVGPYAFGDWWGKVWAILNFPLSTAMKAGLSRYSPPVYVGVVSVLNAGFVYLLALGIITSRGRARRRGWHRRASASE